MGGNFWPEEAEEGSQLPQVGATFLHTKAAVATAWDKTQAGPVAIQEQYRSIEQVSCVALHAFSLPGCAASCITMLCLHSECSSLSIWFNHSITTQG